MIVRAMEEHEFLEAVRHTLSTYLIATSHVFTLTDQFKVVWADAPAVTAQMVNCQVPGNCTGGQLHSMTMCGPDISPDSTISIPVHWTKPEPALIGLVHSSPETLWLIHRCCGDATGLAFAPRYRCTASDALMTRQSAI
jgi:hypothetical protein